MHQYPDPSDPQCRFDLWSSTLDGGACTSDADELLSEDERARASRFRFERDRRRFVARRAFLRRVLAGYLGIAPRHVRLSTAAGGRPELEPSGDLSFNASHSDGLAVVAVARGRRVGVDIERVRPIPDALEIAQHAFTGREYDRLCSTPDETRSEAFLTIWTRKESYVKAVGAGMDIPFDRFDVSLTDDGHSGLARDPLADATYAFTTVQDLDGYIGAVTCRGGGG